MRLKINLAQVSRMKQTSTYLAYLPLLLLLVATLIGNSYWYYSINTDIARYNEKLSSMAQRSLKTKEPVEESIPQKEKESLAKEAAFINSVIKGRTLSWSGLFAHLEKEHIPNISMVSLTPKVVEDKMRIAVRGVGKDLDTITRFMDRLEKSPSFQGVFLSHSSDTDLNGEKLVNFSMEAEYTGK
ncbi:MAG: PilN domain-containing protein [Deltaproteobacteria bacterium]|nr:PilN domain-containing protein [Deltaproteobacteria bacterium]